MSIKLVAIDIDGTLLDSKHQLSAENRRAIQAARAAGVKIVLATGRSYRSCVPFLQQFELETTGLYLNGATVCAADGTLLNSTELPNAAITRTLAFVEAQQLSLVGFNSTGLYTPKYDWLSLHAMEFDEPEPAVVTDWTGLAINKFLLAVKTPAALPAVETPLIEHLAGQATVVRMASTLIAVMPIGINKGTALADLCTQWAITPNSVMAIGNAENDIEMLQFAGTGVAVANAAPAVKAAADVLVASNNANGVAAALAQFL